MLALSIWDLLELAALLLVFDITILIPLGLVFGEWWIKRRAPLMIDDLAQDKDTVGALRDFVTSAVPAAGMLQGGKVPSLKQMMAIGGLAILNKWLGGGLTNVTAAAQTQQALQGALGPGTPPPAAP